MTHLNTLDRAIADLEVRHKPIAPPQATLTDIELISMLSTDVSGHSSSTGASSHPSVNGTGQPNFAPQPNLQFGQSFEKSTPPGSSVDWLDAFLASNPFPWPTEAESANGTYDWNGTAVPEVNQTSPTYDPSFFDFAGGDNAPNPSYPHTT